MNVQILFQYEKARGQAASYFFYLPKNIATSHTNKQKSANFPYFMY